MSKSRYELLGYCSYRDTKTGQVSDNFVGLLNEQDQKIAELEKALELACKYIAYAEIAGNPEIVNENTSINSYKKYQIEHFKSKAKEKLNNDR